MSKEQMVCMVNETTKLDKVNAYLKNRWSISEVVDNGRFVLLILERELDETD